MHLLEVVKHRIWCRISFGIKYGAVRPPEHGSNGGIFGGHPDYNVNNSIKIFRATVFGVRNDTMPKASPGWNISELKGNDNLDWFIELVEKPADVLDNF